MQVFGTRGNPLGWRHLWRGPEDSYAHMCEPHSINHTGQIGQDPGGCTRSIWSGYGAPVVPEQDSNPPRRSQKSRWDTLRQKPTVRPNLVTACSATHSPPSSSKSSGSAHQGLGSPAMCELCKSLRVMWIVTQFLVWIFVKFRQMRYWEFVWQLWFVMLHISKYIKSWNYWNISWLKDITAKAKFDSGLSLNLGVLAIAYALLLPMHLLMCLAKTSHSSLLFLFLFYPWCPCSQTLVSVLL